LREQPCGNSCYIVRVQLLRKRQKVNYHLPTSMNMRMLKTSACVYASFFHIALRVKNTWHDCGCCILFIYGETSFSFHYGLCNPEAFKIREGSRFDRLFIRLGPHKRYMLHSNHCFAGHLNRRGCIINFTERRNKADFVCVQRQRTRDQTVVSHCRC
jgi:hypothetical protein